MSSSERIRIAFAFSPNKEKGVIKPSLIDYAKLHGVDFIRIDLQIPLHHQLPFDCIIHKLYHHSWTLQLPQFSSENPDIVIVDPPQLISPLLHRDLMLQVVKDIKIHLSQVRVQAPKEVVVYETDIVNGFKDLGLKFPLIAKPLEVDGSDKSHEMSLVFNRRVLTEMITAAVPVVLQEFVNHGGVLFKVYVVGEEAVCVKRKSLPDIWESESELEKFDSVMKFSKISRSENQGIDGKSDKCNGGGEEKEVEMPAFDLVMEIARGLREGMRLSLFNFDMIRDQNNTYFIIDINYLPGYAVIPNYEPILTKFFKKVVEEKKKEEEESPRSMADFKEDREIVIKESKTVLRNKLCNIQ